jgi:hypothetical protein
MSPLESDDTLSPFSSANLLVSISNRYPWSVRTARFLHEYMFPLFDSIAIMPGTEARRGCQQHNIYPTVGSRFVGIQPHENPVVGNIHTAFEVGVFPKRSGYTAGSIFEGVGHRDNHGIWSCVQAVLGRPVASAAAPDEGHPKNIAPSGMGHPHYRICRQKRCRSYKPTGGLKELSPRCFAPTHGAILLANVNLETTKINHQPSYSRTSAEVLTFRHRTYTSEARSASVDISSLDKCSKGNTG